MPEITVDFLWFKGCPLAAEAFAQLEEAVDRLKGTVKVVINRIDIHHPDTPPAIRRWGSPTILLNDHDICGADPGDETSCRIYPGTGGVLSAADIERFIILESGP